MPPVVETQTAPVGDAGIIAEKADKALAIGSGAGGATRNPNCNYVENLDQDPYRLAGIAEWETRMAETEGWWTGLAPNQCPGFVDGQLHALPAPNFETSTREEILAYFDNGWTITEMLFQGLLHDATYIRPPWHQLRHPKAFYYVHPASLYINKMRVAGVLEEPLNAEYEQYFETGVDEMSWDDLSKNEMEWPSVPEMRKYRADVYKVVKDVILTHPCLDEKTEVNSKGWSIFLGFEHERIHIETSSVLIRELPIRMVRRPEHWPAYHPSAAETPRFPPAEGASHPANAMITVDRGAVTLGKDEDFPSYGWDNEYGSRTFNVPSFSASKFMVSNGEYWQFVNSRAYQDPQYWTKEGWQWRTFRNAKWPTYWVPFGPQGLGKYKLRTVFEVIDMPWSWPADVNLHEAEAYCNWRTAQDSPEFPYRLITEPEHNRLRNHQSPQKMGWEVDHSLLASGADFKAQTCKVGNYNLHMAYGSECPVDTFEPTASGHHDVFGNVWHWCKGWFCPLPGYKVQPVYDDFSSPCFDGKHAMILGGSFISIGDEASIYSRFHFRPHFFQHAGFRMVQSKEDVAQLETSCFKCPGPFAGSWRGTLPADGTAEGLSGDTLANATTLAHFGKGAEIAPALAASGMISAELLEYPKQLYAVLGAAAAKAGVALGGSRAIDVGAGPGGVSFELARGYEEVVAVEMEPEIVATSKTLQEAGAIELSVPATTTAAETIAVSVDAGIDRARVAFTLMDACCLPLHLGEFDVAVCSEVLTYVQSPKSILGRMSGDHGIVKKGGLLVVASADEWSETTCARDAWLDGTELDAAFELVHSAELPQVLRAHARKVELRQVKVSVYQRKL